MLMKIELSRYKRFVLGLNAWPHEPILDGRSKVVIS